MTAYFAYGSNMHQQRLRERVPKSISLGPARLEGFRLVFHKLGRDGSGKCSVVPVGNGSDDVHGVLFDLPQEQVGALHRAEGFGYDQAWTGVIWRGELKRAMLYIGRDAFMDPALLPFEWYKALVVQGAREAGLPPGYVRQIEESPAMDDPDGRRDQEHRSLLSRIC